MNNSTITNGAKTKRYRNKKVISLFLGLIVVIALIAGYWYVKLRGFVSTDDAYIDGNRVSISTKMLGRIIGLKVDEGDTVTAGQLLVQLDDSDLRAQEEQAKANMDYSEKNVALAKVALQRAQDDYQRSVIQFKQNVIPQEQFDHLKKARDMAQAQYDIALAQVSKARAQLKVVETQLQNTQITAALTGVVAKRWVLAGDVVQPGQPIVTIFDLQNVWVTANFEETKISAIRLDDPVEISVDAYGGEHFPGNVIMIGAAAASQFSLIPPNNASGNFTKVTQRVPVKISFDGLGNDHIENSRRLLPGMSATVKIKVKGNQ